MILTLNAGSSSLKFAVYQGETAILRGQVERLGPAARLLVSGEAPRELGATDHKGALASIMDTLSEKQPDAQIQAVGHRIVHGGTDFTRPTRLTAQVMDKLDLLVPLAPLHQPHNLACAHQAMAHFPQAVQIGCFDTSFHRTHPWVSDTFALPRRFYDEGVRRYGFHGLSYEYISGHLARHHPDLAQARVVVAHLGNGASLCALHEGRSVASTMGFSALDGLPMGTRCGQLDPGVLLYLMTEKNMNAAQISELLYRQSGLLGLSGVTSDMRRLEQMDASEAREAIAYFTFRISREIGALAASMAGIDAIVFCGGIGENSARVRADVIAPLGFLGARIDPEANAAQATELGQGALRILRVPTDEEAVIAAACQAAVAA